MSGLSVIRVIRIFRLLGLFGLVESTLNEDKGVWCASLSGTSVCAVRDLGSTEVLVLERFAYSYCDALFRALVNLLRRETEV